MLNVTGVLSLDTSNLVASVRRDEKNSNHRVGGTLNILNKSRNSC